MRGSAWRALEQPLNVSHAVPMSPFNARVRSGDAKCVSVGGEIYSGGWQVRQAQAGRGPRTEIAGHEFGSWTGAAANFSELQQQPLDSPESISSRTNTDSSWMSAYLGLATLSAR